MKLGLGSYPVLRNNRTAHIATLSCENKKENADTTNEFRKCKFPPKHKPLQPVARHSEARICYHARDRLARLFACPPKRFTVASK